MTRAAVKSGIFAGVYIGNDKVLGASQYTASGMVRKTIESSEFGDDIDAFEYGTADPGTITIANVLKDPANIAGQGALDLACATPTKYGPDEIKFMRDATSYYTVDTGGHILITKSNESAMDRNNLERCSYEFKISGALLVLRPSLVSIAVTPATPSKVIGVTQQFIATATYTAGDPVIVTTLVTWASATPANVLITAGGLAVGIAAGTSVISATMLGISGNTLMTVTTE